ncbi:MAG: tyrosine-protein phosphatase [Ruminococcus sp.]|nr:tyrosine-protein phosphatase [Ruminococcus sp.]
MFTDEMKSLLSSTLNTRELGGYICGSGITKAGRILRSDRICKPSDGDIAYLKALGITTVIDLRTDEDASADPCGLTAEKGFYYRHFPIEEGGYVPASADEVVPSYLAIAAEPNMAGVFRTIANAPAGVIFNCWAGKDRTGVTAAIILMLCGVSDKDITENYMLTKPYSEELWEMIRQYRSEEEMKIIIPDERFIKGFIEGFRAKYGSAEDYLSEIGLKKTEIRAIRDKLCG